MKAIEYCDSLTCRVTRKVNRLWFRFLINRGKLVKVDYRHRGIGKTHMMLKTAIRKDIPIIVGDIRQKDLIKYDYGYTNVFVLRHMYSEMLDGHIFPNGVLIDESVNPKLIKELTCRDIKIRGGFIQNY